MHAHEQVSVYVSVHLGALRFEGSPPEPSLRVSVAGRTGRKPHVSSRNFTWTRCDFPRRESCHWQRKMVSFLPLTPSSHQLSIPFAVRSPRGRLACAGRACARHPLLRGEDAEPAAVQHSVSCKFSGFVFVCLFVLYSKRLPSISYFGETFIIN